MWRGVCAGPRVQGLRVRGAGAFERERRRAKGSCSKHACLQSGIEPSPLTLQQRCRLRGQTLHCANAGLAGAQNLYRGTTSSCFDDKTPPHVAKKMPLARPNTALLKPSSCSRGIAANARFDLGGGGWLQLATSVAHGLGLGQRRLPAAVRWSAQLQARGLTWE